MKHLKSIFLTAVLAVIFVAPASAQVDSTGTGGAAGGLDWTAVITGIVTILVPAVYTFIVKVFPTKTDKWNIFENILKSIPNNKTGGGTH